MSMSPAKSIGLVQKFVNVSEEESPVGSLVDANRDRIRGEYFVPILYREPAFEAFDDFCDHVESVSCRIQKPCQDRGSNPCPDADAVAPARIESKAANHRDLGPVRPEPLACGLANRRDRLTKHPTMVAVLPGKIRSPANDQQRMVPPGNWSPPCYGINAGNWRGASHPTGPTTAYVCVASVPSREPVTEPRASASGTYPTYSLSA